MIINHTYAEATIERRQEKQRAIHRRCLLLLRDLRARREEAA